MMAVRSSTQILNISTCVRICKIYLIFVILEMCAYKLKLKCKEKSGQKNKIKT